MSNKFMNWINYLRVNHPFSILFLIAFLLFNCSKQKDIDYINDALLNTNEKLRLEGKQTELIKLNKKLVQQSIDEGYKKGEALGYINMANIYATIGQYKISHQYLKLASTIAHEINDNFVSAKLYHEYGQMNYVIGLTNTALHYNSKAIYYGKKLDEKGWLLGNMYEQRADFFRTVNKDSSLIYYHKGFDVDPSALNSSLIGDYHLEETKDLDSAEFYLSRAITLIKKKEYQTVRPGIIYAYYGKLLVEKKEYKKALEFYEKAAVILIKTKRKNKLPDLYREMAIVYKNLGDQEKENEYHLKYNQINDSLKLSEKEVIDVSLNESIEKKDTERFSMKSIFIIGGILLLLVVPGLFLYFKRHQNRKKEDDETTAHYEEVKEKISNEDFTELLELAKSNDLRFLKRFEEINPNLYQNLLKINSQLTKSELSLCAMIWLGLSSKDIADFTFMQHRSVQTKKGRLRKKLNIPSEADLYNFFMSI